MSQNSNANTAPALTPEQLAAVTEWQALTEWMDKAKKREQELRNGFARLFTQPKEGVNHLITADGFDLVLDYKVNRKLDVAVLDAVMSELPENSAFRQLGVLIEYKPALVMSGYRLLPDDQRLIFCQALTETPGTPGLEIKRVKTAAEDPATAPAVPDWPATRKPASYGNVNPCETREQAIARTAEPELPGIPAHTAAPAKATRTARGTVKKGTAKSKK